MDVDRTPSVDRAVGQILRREKKIDLLLNNAGFVMAGFWEDLSESDIEAQFQTNVFGLLRVSRAVLPFMRKQGSGRILNIGSVAGFAALPGLGAYSATKFAVNSITEALRMEGRPWGVDVMGNQPGVKSKPMWPKTPGWGKGSNPLYRLTPPIPFKWRPGREAALPRPRRLRFLWGRGGFEGPLDDRPMKTPLPGKAGRLLYLYYLALAIARRRLWEWGHGPDVPLEPFSKEFLKKEKPRPLFRERGFCTE